FPFGSFHGTRVKEMVYRPDWTDGLRLEYTNRLFDLLAQLTPRDVAGSVSTLPGSFKDFVNSREQEKRIRENLWSCVEHISRLSERTGRDLHLGLEPEPLCWLENSAETIGFFEQMRDEHPGDPRLDRHLGVNYDACHFAIEFEQARDALAQFQQQHIKLSKVHISNALRLRPDPASLKQLAAFSDEVYLHQVIVRRGDGTLTRFKDLGEALSSPLAHGAAPADEWRVHFHIPLHCNPPGGFKSTADHVTELLELLAGTPERCSHFEMETYTWAVLPEPLRAKDVCDQLVAEYQWTLARINGAR
ncbi:MAG TPA: metabolite traffic protein EboE, partial [Verrucomicrobiae bacterium]|nr:metabolite traffic protein EboE [Verrucomicrobiae bacterium]